MASQNYPRLSIEDFGLYLLESGELDPIYSGLNGLYTSRTRSMDRFLVAYWCFYHAGFACWMADKNDDEFWPCMMTAAKNETPAPDGGRWPRGSERRHFRGQQAINAITELQDRYREASLMVNYVSDWNAGNEGRKRHNDIASVFARVQLHRGFGDWISFKIADMLDRCVGVPVQFDNAHVFMFTDPLKGVKMAAEHWGWKDIDPAHGIIEGDTRHLIQGICSERMINKVVDLLHSEFGHIDAPPLFDRKVNIQEIETILCKWKSHMNGHYALGKDTNEIAHGLSVSWGKRALDFRKLTTQLLSYTGECD